MKRILLPVISVILVFSGTARIIESQIPNDIFRSGVVKTVSIENENNTKEATEGMAEYSLASIIFLLHLYFGSESSNINKYRTAFEQSSEFSEADVTPYLNEYKYYLKLMIEDEINRSVNVGDPFRRVVIINDLNSSYVGNRIVKLYTDLEIVKLPRKEFRQQFENHIEKKILEFLEHKLHHIQESLLEGAKENGWDRNDLMTPRSSKISDFIREIVLKCIQAQFMKYGLNQPILPVTEKFDTKIK